MVYKIRNKAFNNGFWNQNSARVFLNKKTKLAGDMGSFVTLQVQITRYTQLRILHNYRNISRATKQFMMGDRFLERMMILSIKDHYFQPMFYKAPIEQVFFLVSAHPSHSKSPLS